MKKVLVTGGAGFLGRHVCQRLATDGHTVTSLDVADWPEAPQTVKSISGSVLDPAVLTDVLAGMDVVIHLAANAQLWSADPSVFEALNHQGTLAVMTAAKSAGVTRFIAASSLVVLRGWNDPDRTPISEQGDLPRAGALAGPYCQSKRAAALAVQSAASDPFQTTNLFCGAPVGPWDVNATPPTQMISDLIDGKIPAYLPCRLNLIDVDDLAAAFSVAVTTSYLEPGYVLAGAGIDMADLLLQIGAISGEPMPSARVPYWLAEVSARVSTGWASLSGHPPSAPLAGVRLAKHPRQYDTALAARDLNWKPNPIEPALRRCVEWLRSKPV